MKATDKTKSQGLHWRAEYYSAIIQTVPSAVRVVDTDFNVIIANPAMAALSGRPIEASVGRKCFDVFKGERCHTKSCPLTRIRETKIATKDEVVKERQDGTKLICIVLAAPLLNEKGMLTGIVEIFQDIANQRQTETDLRLAALYARSLIEISLDPLVTISPEGKITDVNKATEQATGITREKLIGTDFSDYFTEPEKARAGYRQVFSQGFVRDYPLTLRHALGSTIDVMYNASVYRNKAGEVQGVFASARDVTKRNILEAELRLASLYAYARSLIEISLDPLITISPEGKITDVNKATEQATGITREKLIGTDFSDYFTEPEKAKAGYQQVLSKGLARDYPLTLCHTSGSLMDVMYNASIYKNEAGEVQGVFAAARDVTELKRAEEELREHRDHLDELVKERTKELKDAQEKLIAAERLATLGQFSGNISHELRNPLGVIASSVYYLKIKLKDADEKVHEHLDRINLSVSNSTAIIESLLNLTRMTAPALTKLDLMAVIRDVVSTAKLPKTIISKFDFQEREVLVNGDHEQLRMAFKNIIKNASEAMEAGGTLTVTIRTSADGRAEVSFADTGSGIAAEDLSNVFQPLFSRKAKGIGFGLSITKMVIEKHGGTIEAKSEPRKGTTFVIQLPLYADKEKEA